MSIVSRFSDVYDIKPRVRSTTAPIATPNILDEVDPLISTNASVRQVSSKYKPVNTEVLNSTSVPLSFLTNDTAKINTGNDITEKLRGGLEVQIEGSRPRSKSIEDLYNKILNNSGITAFNGVLMNLGNSGSMTR